jgi:hypothetical protein
MYTVFPAVESANNNAIWRENAISENMPTS